jgi:hypothetical protein
MFADPLSLTISDPDHSEDEERFVLIGASVRQRVLVVVHAERGDGIRIIGARPATRREKKAYEEAEEGGGSTVARSPSRDGSSCGAYAVMPTGHTESPWDRRKSESSRW